MSKKKLRFIDLFAGAGGLSEGFIREGYIPIAHVEMNVHACDTLKTRTLFHSLSKKQRDLYDKYVNGEISREEFWSNDKNNLLNTVINTEISQDTLGGLFDKIDKLKGDGGVDIIIGGPPCQAYSVAGRARDPESMKSDPRNFLYKYYLEFLKKYEPKMFVFENVPGILSAKNGEHFENIQKGIRKAGYELDFRILNSANFGVLQSRKRVIIIGWKKDLDLSYPEFQEIANEYSVLKDLFSDLPWLAPGTGDATTSYKTTATEYLTSTKIRKEEDTYVSQHIARPQNSRDLEIYRRAN